MARDKQSRKAPKPFGNYLLYEEIARGGMARVFRAGLRGLAGFEKKLVVKQILPELASDPRFVELFVREATTVVSLSHPHIVPVYDLGLVDGIYFLSMEYVEGVTLAEVLRTGPLSPALTAHVGAQLADALAYAHGRAGLVHRDVTPRNIMIDPGGHARLLDFGIAAPAEGAEGGEVFGSPGYMSPEQARGVQVDGRSDVFSLATSLYRALTGEEAFRRPGTGETRERLLAEVRPTFAEVADTELAHCLDSALALRPEDRPDAQTLARSLRSWLAAEHPEGVAEELGQRVEDASARIVEMPTDAAEPNLPADKRSDDSGSEVRTLATRPAFAAMLEEGDDECSTRRMEARAPEREAKGTGDAEAPKEPAHDDAGGDVVGAGDARTPATTGPGPRRLVSLLLVAGIAAAVVGVTAWPTDPGTLPPAVQPAPDAGAQGTTDAGVSENSDAGTAAASPPADAATDAGGDAAQPRAPERPMATLTITATPWANIRLDGRALGTTPLRSRRVSAGSHTLRYDNPPLGRSGQRRLRLSAGQVLWLRLDLSHDPPSVTER